MSSLTRWIAISSLSLLSSLAHAGSNYFGGSLGIGNGKCTGCNIDNGFGMRFYGGHEFNRNFSFEGGFGFVQAEEAFPGLKLTYTQKVFDLTAIASLPVSQFFSLFVRGGLGVVVLDGEWEADDGSTAGLDGGNSVDAIYGFGATYQLANKATLRFEYTSMGKESSHYDSSLGYDVLDTIDASMTTVSYQVPF